MMVLAPMCYGFIHQPVGWIKSGKNSSHFLFRVADQKAHIIPRFSQTERCLCIEAFENVLYSYCHRDFCYRAYANKNKKGTPHWGCTFLFISPIQAFLARIEICLQGVLCFPLFVCIILFFSRNPLFLFKSCCINGGRSRIRTYDRSVMSRWLYQLSYAPILSYER